MRAGLMLHFDDDIHDDDIHDDDDDDIHDNPGASDDNRGARGDHNDG